MQSTKNFVLSVPSAAAKEVELFCRGLNPHRLKIYEKILSSDCAIILGELNEKEFLLLKLKYSDYMKTVDSST